MRWFHRQAARHTGRALHAICTFALLIAVLICVGGGWFAWRLSQGPLEITWLARRLEAAANGDGEPTRLHIGSAALAWEGYRRGIDMPLDIRLISVTATDAAGAPLASVPRAEISLALGALLLGRLRPRSVEIDGAQLRLMRAADGTISLDLGSLGENEDTSGPERPTASPSQSPWSGLLAELAHPAATDANESGNSLISHLRHIRIRDADLVVADRQLGATWRAGHVALDLRRLAQGGVEGNGQAQLELGDQHPELRLVATLAPGGAQTQAQATLSTVQPAALARAAPGLAPLAMLDAPLTVTVRADFGPELALNVAALEAQAGSGHITIGRNAVAIDKASLAAQGNADHVALQRLAVVLHGREGGPVSNLKVSGEARRTAGTVHSSLALAVDQVAFADLSTLWPEGAGGHAREWVTRNITAGTARDAHVSAELDAPADLSDASLTNASGSVTGDGLTVYWLRPIGPIERGQAKLRIIDTDTLEIVVGGGQQHSEGTKGDPLTIGSGRVRITGIEQPTQIGAIEADIRGGLAESIALLREPRLRLLDKHPLPMRDPSGQASVKLNTQLPLEDKVRIEDIAIRAEAHLDDVDLGNVVAGRGLDQATLDLIATNDGLKIDGTGRLAGIDSQISAEMDFRAGGPTQVVQKVRVSGRATAQQLAAAWTDPAPWLSGSADIQASLAEFRNGKGKLTADADLTGAELSAGPLEWHKPAGSPARASIAVTLDHDKLASVDALSLEGKELSIRGAAQYAAGSFSALTLDRIVIGRTEAQGSIRFPPPGSGRAIQAAVSGPLIDLSAAMERSSQPPRPRTDQSPGPPWMLDARFTRAIMAQGASFSGVSARAENDGRVYSRLRVDGNTAPSGPFHLEIAPERGGRHLTASAADAGELLRGLDVWRTMRGGRLTVSGNYDDRRADHPLSGQAEITDFSVRDPSALGRILQAMTLYGLVQAVSGSGLGFSRLIAPFTLTEETLDLGECRAFSPSLGLTAKGRIDLVRDIADVQGTIVPAYFFNSMLGHIPLIGRIFSPEQGGGVFAASYTVRGPLDNPQVSVNPLATLTPGFLRGLFGGF